MILVCGFSITSEELPSSDVVEYMVESREDLIKIKLKTVAKSDNCMAVYIKEGLQGNFDLLEEVAEKTTFVASEDKLVSLLENGGVQEEPEEEPQEDFTSNFEPPVQEERPRERPIAQPIYTQPAPTSNYRYYPHMNLPDVDDSGDEDILFSIPDSSQNITKHEIEISTLRAQLMSKDQTIRDLTKSIDEVYQTQEIQLSELKRRYEEQIDKANNVITGLNKQVEELEIPEDLKTFLKYSAYVRTPRGGITEKFNNSELKKIGKSRENLYTFAAGTGLGLYDMFESISPLIEAKTNALIVDFSNDTYMMSKFVRKSKLESSLHLQDRSIPIKSLVSNIKGVEYIPTTVFNDIAFLGMDWADIIFRLKEYAKDRPIIMLFNSISGFNVRYVISKLSTVSRSLIFTQTHPFSLSSTYKALRFLPESSVSILSTLYVKDDQIYKLVEGISKYYYVMTFSKGVVWDKVHWNKKKVTFKY